jgi:porin
MPRRSPRSRDPDFRRHGAFRHRSGDATRRAGPDRPARYTTRPTRRKRQTRYAAGEGRIRHQQNQDAHRRLYQQQFQQNLHGGLRVHNGHRLSGTYDMIMEFDLEKMKLVPGGSFYIKGNGGYSDGINPDKVGALGNVNADAWQDYAIFVRKWWYRQTFFDKKIDLRIGRIETNKDLFDVSLFANHEDKDFINAFSIRNPTIPHGTNIGAFARFAPEKWLYFQAATLDANSTLRTRSGFDTAFHNNARWVGLWELGVLPQIPSAKGALPGSYRIGWWYDPRVRAVNMKTLGGRIKQRFEDDAFGLYLGADQMIWKENTDPKDTQGLGVFTRFGDAPERLFKLSTYWQIGASYKGLLPKRDNDVTGFSVAQGVLSDQFREFKDPLADRETAYEWYYQVQLYPWMTIAPHVQVITNPGGDQTGRDCVVAGLRIRVVF